MSSITDLDTLITQLKTQLRDGHHLLHQHHDDQVESGLIVGQRSNLIDRVVSKAWKHCFEAYSGLSLLAVGGYGRGELNLYSDIDLLILTPTDWSNDDATRQFIQLLWDIGLEVGHSVRSIQECADQGRSDITIATNMLESRHLVGDSAQNEVLQTTIRRDNFWPAKDFYQAKFDEQVARHTRYDDTAYKLEPNIKSSPGGLRDLQTIAWVANRVYQTSDFTQLAEKAFITESELSELLDSQQQLWRLRNGLHKLCKRSEDRLLIPYQRDLAEQLGYQDDDEQLAVEKLMQVYYLAAKQIAHLNGLLLQHFDQSINFSGTEVIQPIDAHYQFVNNYLSAKDPNLFHLQPSALLGLFQVYQNHLDCSGIHAETVRAIKDNLDKIDAKFRINPDHAKRFISIFQNENGLTHTIRKLDAYGVLGAFIPVYGQIVGQMQHDLFHAYTVDAHTLMVVRNLRRLVIGIDEEDVGYPTKIAQAAQNRYRIYLGALFHDVAKGRGGNHHTLGAEDATEFCQNIGICPEDTMFISWLVLQHLLMSKTSQREDLSDPEVIERFAQTVGDQDHLDALFLLTVADIRGTSHATWTPWKGHLLNALHRNTSHFLQTQNNKQISIPVNTQKIAKNSALTFIGDDIGQHNVLRFWEMLDEDYFLHYPPIALAWHAQIICGANLLDLPLVVSRYSTTLKTQTYVIYTADSDQLLSTITGTFDRLNQNIVDARIHSALPGYTLLIFTLTLAHNDKPSEEDLQSHNNTLKENLIQSTQLTSPTKRMLPRRMQGFSVETEITFKETSELEPTTMSLVTLDQSGLMHQIANVLAECHIKLISAKISTVGEKVEDVFRISDAYGQPLDSTTQNKLSLALLDALN